MDIGVAFILTVYSILWLIQIILTLHLEALNAEHAKLVEERAQERQFRLSLAASAWISNMEAWHLFGKYDDLW